MTWPVPFDQIYAPIRGVCKRLTRGNAIEWEDLAQETYIKILVDYTEAVEDLLSWAKTICFRTFASMMRYAKVSFRSCLHLDDYAETLAAPPNQEDRVLCVELSGRITNNLARRHLLSDWDHEDIAVHYGATYKSVAQATYNTRKRLRELL